MKSLLGFFEAMHSGMENLSTVVVSSLKKLTHTLKMPTKEGKTFTDTLYATMDNVSFKVELTAQGIREQAD
jgi:hypothetical protein